MDAVLVVCVGRKLSDAVNGVARESDYRLMVIACRSCEYRAL